MWWSGRQHPPDSTEQAEEHDRVREEQHGDDDRHPGQVPLDDVRAALRGRGEAHPSEPCVAAGVHQDQRDSAAEQDVEDAEEGEHGGKGTSAKLRVAASRIALTRSPAICSFVRYP